MTLEELTARVEELERKLKYGFECNGPIEIRNQVPGTNALLVHQRVDGSAIVAINETSNAAIYAVGTKNSAAIQVDQKNGQDGITCADISGVGADMRAENVIGKRLCVSPGGEVAVGRETTDGKIVYSDAIRLMGDGSLRVGDSYSLGTLRICSAWEVRFEIGGTLALVVDRDGIRTERI